MMHDLRARTLVSLCIMQSARSHVEDLFVADHANSFQVLAEPLLLMVAKAQAHCCTLQLTRRIDKSRQWQCFAMQALKSAKTDAEVVGKTSAVVLCGLDLVPPALLDSQSLCISPRHAAASSAPLSLLTGYGCTCPALG